MLEECLTHTYNLYVANSVLNKQTQILQDGPQNSPSMRCEEDVIHLFFVSKSSLLLGRYPGDSAKSITDNLGFKSGVM